MHTKWQKHKNSVAIENSEVVQEDKELADNEIEEDKELADKELEEDKELADKELEVKVQTFRNYKRALVVGEGPMKMVGKEPLIEIGELVVFFDSKQRTQ